MLMFIVTVHIILYKSSFSSQLRKFDNCNLGTEDIQKQEQIPMNRIDFRTSIHYHFARQPTWIQQRGTKQCN